MTNESRHTAKPRPARFPETQRADTPCLLFVFPQFRDFFTRSAITARTGNASSAHQGDVPAATVSASHPAYSVIFAVTGVEISQGCVSAWSAYHPVKRYPSRSGVPGAGRHCPRLTVWGGSTLPPPVSNFTMHRSLTTTAASADDASYFSYPFSRDTRKFRLHSADAPSSPTTLN